MAFSACVTELTPTPADIGLPVVLKLYCTGDLVHNM